MNFLACYKKELKKQPVINCSEVQHNRTFKQCLSSLDDESFDDYMTLYAQVFSICQYFNGSRPIVTVETFYKVGVISFIMT